MVDLDDQASTPHPDLSDLVRDAEHLLGAVGFAGAELSLLLCDDAFIRPLNAQWRQVDAATDVLSFPQEEDPQPGVAGAEARPLGDVVISVETAARQAAALGHPLEWEIRALLIHGLLHLLGHDHEADAVRKEAMQAEEGRLHLLLGLPRSAALIRRAR